MKFLDTNVFIRYLTNDDPVKAGAVRRLLTRARDGLEEVTTSEAVICEIAFVLSSRAHYGLTHDDVSARVRPLLGIRGLKLERKSVYLRAFDTFASYEFLDFEDALTCALMEEGIADELVSYDTDFDRVPGISRAEP